MRYLYHMKILISEQQLKRIITEQSSTVVVSGTYTANDCDELHAFQSTKQIINGKQVSKIIGNMNVLVGNKLEELYKGGMNPMVSKVDVSVNGMTVNWSCTIVPSPDGKSWVGFTSRGAGCNDDVINRAESVSRGNDMESAKKRIMATYTESNIDIQKVNDFIHKGGQNSFRQVFYRYTKPNSFPPVGGKTTSVDKPNNTQQSTFNGKFEDGKTYVAIRDKDDQKYQLTVQNLENVNGKNFNMKIVGPGTYGGQKLNGQAFELTLTSPNVLSGNSEMGDFIIQ